MQERELGAVGLRQDVRASVFTENCKVQVAQRTPGRRNTLQVGAGRARRAQGYVGRAQQGGWRQAGRLAGTSNWLLSTKLGLDR